MSSSTIFTRTASRNTDRLNEEMPDVRHAQSSGSILGHPDADSHASHASSSSSSRTGTTTDPRTMLHHVLAMASSPGHTAEGMADRSSDRVSPSGGERSGAEVEERNESWQDECDTTAEVRNPASPTTGPHSTPATGNRRAPPGGTGSSVYSGNKMKNIKKEDGAPLWRWDIQYDFLRGVFEDKTPAFTNIYDGTKNCTFVNLYVDAMARSSKTSKILRDKLLSEPGPAANMAMVCLLVNVGRMNTTLNFFPEMRAQLRTYHAIPCLQAHQDANAYKQLQDAPRLKSILKGACEDEDQPDNLEKLRELPVPRTNPVNLIFILSQYAPKLAELHFSPQLEFFDLITRTTLSSRSRANGFLWLMWWYLESDFSREAAAKNPFGPGQPPEVDGIPQKLPAFEHLTEEQAALENQDTSTEIAYGIKKQEERRQIIENDRGSVIPSARNRKKVNAIAPYEEGGYHSMREGGSPFAAASYQPKRRKHSHMEGRHSDSERSRSPSPTGRHPSDGGLGFRSSTGMRINNVLNNDSDQFLVSAGGRYPGDKDFSSPGPPVINSNGTLHVDIPKRQHFLPSNRRPRPLTAHQLAVERNRQERINYVLHQRRRAVFRERRKIRTEEGAIWRAWVRHEAMTDPFENSGDEAPSKGLNGPFKTRGPGGLVPLEDEDEDFGEEAAEFAAGLRRAVRRLDRWGLLGEGREGVRSILERAAAVEESTPTLVQQAKKTKSAAPPRAAVMHPLSSPTVGDGGGDGDETDVEDEGELDDMDRELLGEMDVDDDDDDDDEEVDDEDEEIGEGDDGDEQEDVGRR